MQFKLLDICGRAITTHGINGAVSPYVASSAAADAAWPSANLAVYVPVRIISPVTIVNMAISNGSPVSGNFDIGIYDSSGRRLVSSGSTAQSGGSAVQIVDITDTLLGRGCYYFALAFDNATGQITRSTFSLTASICNVIGVAEEASAFPLPATATFATPTNNCVPAISAGILTGIL